MYELSNQGASRSEGVVAQAERWTYLEVINLLAEPNAGQFVWVEEGSAEV